MSRNSRISVNRPKAKTPLPEMLFEARPGNKPDIFVGIPIAAHQELTTSVLHTLNLLKDQTYNAHNFRVYLFLNSPSEYYHSDNFNVLRDSLEKFAAQNPNFPLTVLQQAFPNGTPIGEIKASLWNHIIGDATNKAGVISKNKLGMSFDIDICDISKTFFEYSRGKFEICDINVALAQGLSGISSDLKDAFVEHVMVLSELNSERLALDFNLVDIFVRYNFLMEQFRYMVSGRSFEAAGVFRLNAFDLVGGVNRENNLCEILSRFHEIADRFSDEMAYPNLVDIGEDMSFYVPTPYGSVLIDDQIVYDFRRQLYAMSKGNMPADCWVAEGMVFSQTDDLRDPKVLIERIPAIASMFMNNISRIVRSLQNGIRHDVEVLFMKEDNYGLKFEELKDFYANAVETRLGFLAALVGAIYVPMNFPDEELDDDTIELITEVICSRYDEIKEKCREKPLAGVRFIEHFFGYASDPVLNTTIVQDLQAIALT